MISPPNPCDLEGSGGTYGLIDVAFSGLTHGSHPGGLVRTDCWTSPSISDSVGPGQGLRMCVSSKLPGGDAPGPGMGTTLGGSLKLRLYLRKSGTGARDERSQCACPCVRCLHVDITLFLTTALQSQPHSSGFWKMKLPVLRQGTWLAQGHVTCK